MGKYVVSMIVTADGYHEGPGGDVMAMPFDDGFSRANVELLRTAGALLFGRRGYDGGAYWSRVVDDESEPPIEREIGRLNAALPKVVVSDTVEVDPAWPWASTTRVVRVADLPAELAAMKHGDGGDILTFGSATTWNPLLEAGLVDELHLLIGPALLGSGTPLFRGSPRVPLRLLESRTLPDSQLVRLRYDATREAH